MPRIEVAAGLVFHRGRLLLTQRRTGDHLGGLWEFPGGKREPSESLVDCLHRELSEELGIRVDVGILLERVEHDYPEKSVALAFFRCKLVAGEPRPIGCQDIAWVRPEELSDYAFPAADERLLKKLRQTPALWGNQDTASTS